MGGPNTPNRSGGQPNQSGDPANAGGVVVINGSGKPQETDAQRKQRYLDAVRQTRQNMGVLGQADAAVRGAANYLTFGYADNVAAGADALLGSGEGGTIAERYQHNMEVNQAVNQVDAQDRPTAQTAGEVGASLLPVERLLRFLPKGEKILKWLKKGRSNCKKCSKNPVILSNGSKTQFDVDFLLTGALPIELSRSYLSSKDSDGPLGRNRTGSLDETLALRADGTIAYSMLTGIDADFDRPAPIPGQTSINLQHPNLALIAGEGTGFIVRDMRLLKLFDKYADGIWRLVAMHDLNDNHAVLVRDAAGRLQRLDRSDGFSVQFTNDGDGHRVATTLRSPAGETRQLSRYRYDTRGNLVEVHNSYAGSCRYEYDAAGRLVAFQDAAGFRHTYAYDAANRVVAVGAPGGVFDHTIAYDSPEPRVTTLTHVRAEGAAVRYGFDEQGHLVSETDGLGHVRRTERDEFGGVLAEIDAEGNRTSYGYDAFGRVSAVTDPEGRRTAYYYDEDGLLERLIAADGSTWSWGYDERGNLAWARDALGYRTDYVTNSAGQPTRIMRHDGLIEQREYDSQHRLVRLVDFKGGVTRFERDDFGRLVALIDPAGGITRFAYAELPGTDFWASSTLTRPDGTSVTRSAEPDKALVTVVDGEGRASRYRYGPFDLLDEIEDPMGGRVRFRYDHDMRLVRVVNQTGRVWTFERDAAGRVHTERDFDGLSIRYTHDKADRLVETAHADGARIRYAYDRSGRTLRQEAWEPDALASSWTRFWYDGRGRLAGAENEDARIAFERDAVGQVVAETMNGRRVESAFDCCGNRLERRIGGRLVSSLYDPLGELRSLALGAHVPLTFERDPLGRETRRRSAAGFQLMQAWDAVGQLRRQSGGAAADSRAPSGTWGLDRQFEWNGDFAPVAVHDTRWGEAAYREQGNGQIVDVRFGDGGSEAFAYDAAFNLEGAAAEGQPIHRWTQAGDGKVAEARGPHGERLFFAYDARHRVVERRVERDGFRAQVTSYAWDAEDRLKECRTPSGDHWTYAYDPFGRRVTKRRVPNHNELVWIRSRFPALVQPVSEGGPSALDVWPARPKGATDVDTRPPAVGTAYLWDGEVIAEEAPLRLDGSVDWDDATRWHYEPRSAIPLAKETADGTLHYIVTDHLGTARELFDEKGDLVWAAEYRTWGSLRRLWAAEAANDNDEGRTRPGHIFGSLALKYDAEAAAAAQICPLRFQGQWEDPETGLTYNRYRHYDPAVARYASSDPIGIVGGLRPSAYVANPNNDIDPAGLAGGSTVLRGNLQKAGCVPSGVSGVPWQAQHNIPQQVWDGNQKFFDNIGLGTDPKTGANPRDAASNGTALPTNEEDGKKLGLCCHRGSHPKYNKDVQSRVEQIRDAYNNGQISAADARGQISNLQQSLGQEMMQLPAGCRIS